jgi:uncharacterized protein (DUF2147 family)
MKARAVLSGMLALAAAAPVAAASPAGPPADLRGVWHNPDGSVQVRIDQCGNAICGVVVRASAEAQADARDGGYPQLIGLPLLHDYRAKGPRYWVGRVLVPDLGHEFPSHIELVDQAHARIAGCLIGQHLCQTQVWQRD